MTKLIPMLCGLGLVLALQANAPAQTITNPPQSITINNASTAMFSVGASNATSYQWYFNGTNNLSDGAKSDGVIITGSATSALTLEDVTSNEAGSYTVLVNGSVSNSQPAILTITNGTIVTFTFSGILGGGTTNMTVQLFDHDKPATVQNFLHYINSGAYKNLFMQRCVPGFILQGGSYGASNRTDTSLPITGWDVPSLVATFTNQTPFPLQVAGEFYHGPQIKNDFGTLAMALQSAFLGGGLPNSARNGFFFNLADNSGSPYNFDTTNNGPFTVFGRVISGTNVLQYFNTLTTNKGIVTNSQFLDNGAYYPAPGVSPFQNLLVNYIGSSNAANANLVYCDFSFLATLPADTNPPTVSITSPAANALLTNGPVIQGTASDDVGLADVICVLIPQETNGIYPNGGLSVTNNAVGATNWSLTFLDSDPVSGNYLDNNGFVLPGAYNLIVQSQDGAGNLSAASTNLLTITAVTTNGNGIVSFVQGAPANDSPIGYPLQEGSNYWLTATAGTNWGFVNWIGVSQTGSQTVTNQKVSFTMTDGVLLTANFRPLVPLHLIILGNGMVSPTNGEYVAAVGGSFQVTASPGPGQKFYAWSDGAGIFTNSTSTFTMTSNMTLIAEFVSSHVPRALSFTYPTANAKLTTNSFPLSLRGKIAASAGSAQITCQISSLTTGLEAGPLLTTNGTKTWSVTVTNLPPDDYMVNAVATNGAGESWAVSEEFAVLDFKGVTGTYSGLFICTNSAVTSGNSGFFSFTVGASGAFSGRMLFPAYKPVPIIAGFYANGSVAFSLTHIPGNPVVVLYLDLTNGTDALTGSVYSDSSGWSSQLVCYRAVRKLSAQTAAATGKYVLSLDPTNWPDTNGYASLSVGGGGVLSLSGALPDGASFSQSARVSKDGVWPLYVIPAGYKTNGMLMGWETNQADGSTGLLYWQKGPHIGTYFTSGVDVNVNSTGTNYVAPAATNYSIVFQGGTLSVPVTNKLEVTRTGGQFKPEDATNKLTIALSANGVVTGHFVTNNHSKPLQFKGVFIGQSQTNSGFILDGDGQTGYYLLEPQEPQ